MTIVVGESQGETADLSIRVSFVSDSKAKDERREHQEWQFAGCVDRHLDSDRV
jgi:hypothetical protein